MQLKFDANQEFQLQAIEAVANIFDGQPRTEKTSEVFWKTPQPQRSQADFRSLSNTFGFAAVANRLDLSAKDLLANLKKVQKENGVEPDETLIPIEQTIETVEGKKLIKFFNFSVEMETGTGKTYVYLRTAFELFRRYGLRKPSVSQCVRQLKPIN